MPVAAMVDYLDGMRLGFEVARLEWQGDIAVLTVDSLMGNDTIEQIEAAYDEIAAHGAHGLIVDLRSNGGGAFAVKPLVEHIIDEPMDAGFFISRRWTENNVDLPDASDVESQTPATLKVRRRGQAGPSAPSGRMYWNMELYVYE